MRRIQGYCEWDEDDLTPGQKKKGGLHQNLYDSEGNLKGNARFIHDDQKGPDSLVITETVYVTVEQRRRDQGDKEFQRAVAELVSHLIYRGLVKAKPFAQQWWQATARPGLDAQRAKMLARRKMRKSTGVVAGTAVEPSQELTEASEDSRPNMSSSEAQARYLAALAAQAYSDEQIRLVTSASIVNGEGFEGLERSVAELPPDQVRTLIEAMVTNPSMLGDATLAQLASILGRRALRDDVSRQSKPALEQPPPTRC